MYTAAVITVSDSAYQQKRVDTGGPLVAEMLTNSGFTVINTTVVPDEQQLIEKELINACDILNANLIITTGGTGFSKRDVTPEATTSVCDKMADGIADVIRMSSIQKTPKAMLSRAEAGIRNNSIIINLPGNPNAVWESLQAVLPVLPHGIDVLLGNVSDCAE